MQIAYLLDNYTLLNQFTENIKKLNPDRNKHNMQLLQIHAIIALIKCIFCTNLDWLLSGVSDGHSSILRE
jgi:hypothetical protein